RNIEETLDLPGMKVDRQNTIGTCLCDQVGDQLCGNRSARTGLPVLPRVPEVRDHRRDALGGGAAAGVDPDQQLHQVIVGGIAGRLQQEEVFAADVLVNLDEDLFVGKPPNAGVGQRDVQVLGDRAGERQVGIAGHQFHYGRALVCACRFG